MWGVVTRLGRKEGRLRGMTKQLYEMRYIVAKNGREALGGGWEGRCVFGRRRGELVQDQGPGEERTEKHPIRDPLARCRLQVAGAGAGAGQQAALASKRQLNN